MFGFLDKMLDLLARREEPTEPAPVKPAEKAEPEKPQANVYPMW